jgi:peptidyl-prolyl cis-trans isomerase C
VTARVCSAVALALTIAAGGCGHPPPPAEASASLNGAVARVGSVRLPPALVADVARAKGSSMHDAVEELVRDALAAQGAQAGGEDREPAVAWQITSALARRVPQHLLDAAAAQGPPTDDELALVSVVHAVVMRSATLRERDALALADSIRQAVAGARSADEFKVRAEAVPHARVQLVVQPVGPFGADGRDNSGAGRLDAGFVAAAFALHAPFETSAVVASPFGWHVIQLVERRAADGSRADRPRDLASDVVRMRARTMIDAVLQARTSVSKVEVSVGADALMAQAIAAP